VAVAAEAAASAAAAAAGPAQDTAGGEAAEVALSVVQKKPVHGSEAPSSSMGGLEPARAAAEAGMV
jgi:hypothetical protein